MTDANQNIGLTLLLGVAQGPEMYNKTVAMFIERGLSFEQLLSAACSAGLMLADETANELRENVQDVLIELIKLTSEE